MICWVGMFATFPCPPDLLNFALSWLLHVPLFHTLNLLLVHVSCSSFSKLWWILLILNRALRTFQLSESLTLKKQVYAWYIKWINCYFILLELWFLFIYLLSCLRMYLIFLLFQDILVFGLTRVRTLMNLFNLVSVPSWFSSDLAAKLVFPLFIYLILPLTSCAFSREFYICIRLLTYYVTCRLFSWCALFLPLILVRGKVSIFWLVLSVCF